MLLWRFTDKSKKYGLALLALSALVLAGCATGPDRQSSETRGVPHKAQTLYEQAVA